MSSPKSLLPEPSTLKLVLYPYRTLLEKAEPVSVVDGAFEDPSQVRAYADRIRKIMLSMGDNAIGLAANQVGLLLRMFVCFDDLNDPSKKNRAAQVYINPEIVSNEGSPESHIEGCLSFPGISGNISRKPKVTLRYLDEQGQVRLVASDGLQARCWLHEIDHLNGVNIIDGFSAKDLRRNKMAIERLRKRG